MDSKKSHRYSSNGHDLPEVVPNQDAPEVIHQNEPPIYRGRQTSVDKPESVDVAAHHGKQAGEYYFSDLESAAPPFKTGAEPNRHDDLKASGEKRDDRRYCGMRRSVFIIIIVVVILAVVLGVVLGAVLGIVLPNKSGSNDAPLQAISTTGIATVTSGDTLYQYFQLPDNSVVENAYTNGEWSLNAGSSMQDATVTTAAGAGSPLAAIIYPYNGATHRQLFFITAGGLVHTTNRTETGSWSAPVAITQDVAQPGSIALAACWNDQYLDGLRIYFASQYGYIQEVGGYFNGSSWPQYYSFTGSDPNSGVACSVHNEPNNEWINVYYRYLANNTLLQTFYTYYPTKKAGWYNSQQAWRNQTIIPGSDVAVCDDPGGDTEYVFYQLASELITVGISNPDETYYETFVSRQTGSKGSKLAAAWVQGGAMVAFQNSSSDSTIWASDVSRAGVTIFNKAMT